MDTQAAFAVENSVAPPPDRLVKIYIKMREAKAAAKKAHEVYMAETFEQPMAIIQAELKRLMLESHTEGFKTEFGTVYMATTLKPPCQDWGNFFDWCKENDGVENYLEKRLSATAIKEYMESNAGALPPGITVFRELEARVRKPGEK